MRGCVISATIMYNKQIMLLKQQQQKNWHQPGAPNESIVQNHLKIALLNVF